MVKDINKKEKSINVDTCCIKCKRYGTTPSNFPIWCSDNDCPCHSPAEVSKENIPSCFKCGEPSRWGMFCNKCKPAELNLASQEDWRKRLMDKFCVMFERAERESIEGNHYWKSEDWVALLEDFIENLLSLARTEADIQGFKRAEVIFDSMLKSLIDEAVAEYQAELVSASQGMKKGTESRYSTSDIIQISSTEKELIGNRGYNKAIDDIINLIISPNKE